MKRLIVSVLMVVFCLGMFSVPAMANPGDETDTQQSDEYWASLGYPPPPPGYDGEWPLPGMEPTTDGGDSGTGETGDGGDEDPWIDPSK